MDKLLTAAQALVERFKETTAVHDEVAALEVAIADAKAEKPAPPPPPAA